MSKKKRLKAKQELLHDIRLDFKVMLGRSPSNVWLKQCYHFRAETYTCIVFTQSDVTAFCRLLPMQIISLY
jgi:hypothetical protein